MRISIKLHQKSLTLGWVVAVLCALVGVTPVAWATLDEPRFATQTAHSDDPHGEEMPGTQDDTQDDTQGERRIDPCQVPPQRAHWLDRSHSYLNERLCAPAVWFDGFFGDPRTLEETPVNTFFRVRSTLGWDQADSVGGGLQVKANIALPRLSERVRVLVSRDQAAEGDRLDGAGLDDLDDKTRLGVRFILSDELVGLTDVDATVRVESGSLNPRVSARYLMRYDWSDNTLIRGTQTAFWERVGGFGTRSRVDVEFSPNYGRLLRWTTRGTFSEASNGVDWKSVLVGYQQLDGRTALRADAGVIGRTRPTSLAEEVFVSARIRRQWLRPWLFVELRPEHAWPKASPTAKRRSDWRLKLTFEIQFENNPSSHRRRWDIQR